MSNNCQSLAQDAEASGAYPFGSALVPFAAAFLTARVARVATVRTRDRWAAGGLLTEEHSLDRRDDGPTIARQLVLRLG